MTEAARTETWEGKDLLDRLGEPLDELHSATGTPLTARRTWLRRWAACYPDSQPWAFVVRDPVTGHIDAAALLCRRILPGGLDVSPLGFGRNDRSRLPARTTDAAHLLADTIARELVASNAPWTLRVEQMPTGDPVIAGLVSRLPVAALLRGGDVPRVQFDPGRPDDMDAHVGKALRKVLRKSRNRIDADGHEASFAWEASHRGVLDLIDEVEHTHRGRDHAVGRESDLDSAGGAMFWRDVILAHAEHGSVEIATLRLGGALAAYVVSFLDGNCYRVFDGRFDTEWSRYSPGRLLETATLEHVLAQDRFTMLDWMNSVAPDKLISSNAVETTEHLVACSPDRVLDLDRTRDRIVELRDREPQPTADLALRALAGVGRAPGRREAGAPRR